METYRGWALLDEMPDGWAIDRTCGSPLHGYEVITNRKSMLSGNQRALLRIDVVATDGQVHAVRPYQPAEEKPKQEINEKYMRTMNQLARKKFEEHLLMDIRIDLAICDIEGWDKREYLNELKKLIDGIAQLAET